MRYDRGFGPGGSHGYDWTFRYQGGGRGYDHGYHVRGRDETSQRPWVGGYRDDFQGGSGGYSVGTSGYLHPDRTIAGRPMGGGYDQNFANDRAEHGFRRRPGGQMQGRPMQAGGQMQGGQMQGGGQMQQPQPRMRAGAGYGGDFRGQEMGGRQMEAARGYDWRYVAGNDHPQRHGGEMRGSMSANDGIGRWDPWF